MDKQECHKAKTNEIPISKELVDMLKLKDTVITADAMLCQKEVIEKIAKDNDYIIAIKGNQKYMFEGVKETHELKLGYCQRQLLGVLLA